ncbi:MAG: archaeosortase H N-terminal-like domain-containing protein [Promethearchaeota archaeon]
MKPLIIKMIGWLMLTCNLLFAFVIGITIPLLESEYNYNLGIVMIPLLIILNYIIVDRIHYYIKHSKDREVEIDAKN